MKQLHFALACASLAAGIALAATPAHALDEVTVALAIPLACWRRPTP